MDVVLSLIPPPNSDPAGGRLQACVVLLQGCGEGARAVGSEEQDKEVRPELSHLSISFTTSHPRPTHVLRCRLKLQYSSSTCLFSDLPPKNSPYSSDLSSQFVFSLGRGLRAGRFSLTRILSLAVSFPLCAYRQAWLGRA